MNRIHLFALALLLIVAGAGIFVYKATVLNFPLRPDTTASAWNVEAHVAFDGQGVPARLSLFLPRTTRRHVVVNENFISRGYGVNVQAKDGNRSATWTVRSAKGRQSLYYRAVIRPAIHPESPVPAPGPAPGVAPPALEGAALEAAQALIAEIHEKSADADSFTAVLLKQLAQAVPADQVKILLSGKDAPPARVRVAVDLLALARIPARTVHGFRTAAQARQATPVHWIEVYDAGQWQAYDPATGEAGVPDEYVAWWRGSEPIIKAKGVKNPSVEITVSPYEEEYRYAATEMGLMPRREFLVRFSLFSLPIQTQAVYRVLMLVPAGILVLVVLRNIVGVRTFGTFMPVLVALAFRETQLLWGVVLFSLLVAAGMGFRLYLDRLKLLVVPRLAAVLIVVILLMGGFSLVTHLLDLERGLSVALFPMVILTMTIERMSIVWEELGPGEALAQGAGTLAVSALVYLLMQIQYLEHLFFTFPELLLILLAVVLLLGRYSGFRLLELRRFRRLQEIGTEGHRPEKERVRS